MWNCSSALSSGSGSVVKSAPSDSNALLIGAKIVTSSRPEMPTAACFIAAASVERPAWMRPSMIQLSVGSMVSFVGSVWTLL
jgi:hypothetical protein